MGETSRSQSSTKQEPMKPHPPVTSEPFARFAAAGVAMQSTATTGTVTLNTSAAVFVAEHLGGMVRMKGKQIQLTNIQTSTQAVGLVLHGLKRHARSTAREEWSGSSPMGRARHRVVSWLREFF